MVILRAFYALLGGFVTMTALLLAARAIVARLVPSWMTETGRPGMGATIFNFGDSFLAAAAGGYVTAWIGAERSLADLLGLGMIVLVAGGLGALHERGKQPIAYQLALVAIAPVGVVVGGLLRLRVSGVLL
jgi:hypothetical protein